MKKLFLAHVLSVALVGCGSDPSAGDDSPGQNAEPSGHIHVDVTMNADDDGVGFVSNSSGTFYAKVQDIVGKPYFVVVFEGGFSPGNDKPLSLISGRIDDSLKFVETTKESLPAGPYDVAVILYFKTPISEAQMTGKEDLPYPKSGDVAALTNSDARVLEGDPPLVAGTIRMNITEGDTSVEIANRHVPANATPEEAVRATTDTLFMFP